MRLWPSYYRASSCKPRVMSCTRRHGLMILRAGICAKPCHARLGSLTACPKSAYSACGNRFQLDLTFVTNCRSRLYPQAISHSRLCQPLCFSLFASLPFQNSIPTNGETNYATALYSILTCLACLCCLQHGRWIDNLPAHFTHDIRPRLLSFDSTHLRTRRPAAVPTI
jgi:hypothetical protein